MTTTIAVTKLDPEAFFRLPGGGDQYELVDGEMVKMPDGGGVHGYVVQNFNVVFVTHVRSNGLGEVPAPTTGFMVGGDVRKPDVAFIPRAQCVHPRPEKWIPTPPALAVEVLSPSDIWREVEAKVLEYLDAGTREVWVANPFSKTLHIWTQGPKVRLLQGDDPVTSPDLLPGLSVPLSEFFR